MTRYKSTGFTLIELIIVIVIIAILTGIAYPAYTHHVIKARRTEAQVALLQLAQKMERYYSENHTYIGATLESVGNPNTSGDSPYNSYYTLAITNLSVREFTAIAIPIGTQLNQDKDCGTLAINQLGQKGRYVDHNLVVDKACW